MVTLYHTARHFSPPHLYSLPKISPSSPGNGLWATIYEERRCWANCRCN